MNTKKAIKAKDEALACLSSVEKKHYKVWIYMFSHKCTLTKAYQAIYKCSAEAAKSSASRLQATNEWQTLCSRLEDAAAHNKETIKVEIVAAMLDILHDPKAYPGDKTKAAQVLARTFDLENHTVTVQVDAVQKYAEESLKAAAKEPLLPCFNEDGDPIDNVIDV